MSPKQTLLAQYFKFLLTEFDQTFTTDGFRARMTVSDYGVKRSMVKVTVRSSMPQNALFGLVSMTSEGDFIELELYLEFVCIMQFLCDC